MKKIHKKERTHRLLVKKLSLDKLPYQDLDGETIIPTEWEEVQEVNLGSCSVPNKTILLVRFEPIKLSVHEEDDDDDTPDWQKWFKNQKKFR